MSCMSDVIIRQAVSCASYVINRLPVSYMSNVIIRLAVSCMSYVVYRLAVSCMSDVIMTIFIFDAIIIIRSLSRLSLLTKLSVNLMCPTGVHKCTISIL